MTNAVENCLTTSPATPSTADSLKTRHGKRWRLGGSLTYENPPFVAAVLVDVRSVFKDPGLPNHFDSRRQQLSQSECVACGRNEDQDGCTVFYYSNAEALLIMNRAFS